MAELPNSTFLDFTSYGTTDAATVEAAYGITNPQTPATGTINVALVLPRANDPTALLTGDWATRQTTLAALNSSGTLWSTYGASTTDYNSVIAGLAGMGIPVIGDANGTGGYVTSAESRTIWVSLTPANFQNLFGQELFTSASNGNMDYWHGNLSVPDGWAVKGLWFDTAPWFGTYPAQSNLAGSASVVPQQGPLSIGNGLAESRTQSNNFSQDISNWFYNFPLAGQDIATATVGLLEPGVGDAIPAGASYTFQDGLTNFLQQSGSSATGSYYNVATNGEVDTDSDSRFNPAERSLDIGVVASANPQGTIGLYAGSGTGGNANANDYTAFQSAFWDHTNSPPVVSSSYGLFQQSSPNSPFAEADRELFVDAALRNISTFLANNDWGSGYNFADGLANQNPNFSSPYAVLVGGTSLTTLAAAPGDPSIYSTTSPAHSLYGQAVAGDPATLWALIAGGLTTLPRDASTAADTALLESVWNVYALKGTLLDPGFGLTVGGASDGGVDTTQPTPLYQTAFGLIPTTANPSGGTGRGAPDVAALAGGNMMYYGPSPSMNPGGKYDYWGTSASTPLWATLAAQIDTIFEDQGLPQLGYMNDLLYMAAAIAPASFNDITMGNNVSSFRTGGDINAGYGVNVTLTGYGYSAGPGYDLTTGLGSPNGTLLARALTTIAHAQMSFADTPDVLNANGSGGWTSGADQSLLFQTNSSAAVNVRLFTGSGSESYTSAASSPYAWTSRLAEQSLQPGFDPNLVTLFDMQTQGALTQATVSSGDIVAANINAATTKATQASLSTPFGFADFFSGNGDSAVRVARPVMVAETAGGQNDQNAVVRLRSDGQDSLSVEFYRVDDMNGTINGLRPGQADYAAAADARAYSDTSGDTLIKGPSYGNYEQTELTGVNAGDLIAMKLVNNSHGNTFWSFAQANETVNGASIGHLWNYGVNTWGWEDTYAGGDRDYNDLVVGIDFTSAAGRGLLA